MRKIKLNNVIVSGYVPRDCFVNDAKNFLAFSLGVDDSWYNAKENKWENNTSWIPVKLNGKEDRIVSLQEKLVGGTSNVIVQGQLKQSTYKDKNGNDVNDVYIRATSIQVPDQEGNSNGNSSNGGEADMSFMNDMEFDPYKG